MLCPVAHSQNLGDATTARDTAMKRVPSFQATCFRLELGGWRRTSAVSHVVGRMVCVALLYPFNIR